MPSLAASCALACFALGLGARGASAAAPAAAPPPPSALASARELASSVLSRVLPEAGDRLVLNDTQLCLNHNLVFGECGPASHWRVDKTGVRCGSKCLVRTFGGGLALDECARAAERALTLQNGRLCLGERCDRCIAAPFAAGRGARKRDRCGAIILARAPAYWALMAVLTLGAMWLVGAGVLLCLSGELRVGAPSAAALASARALLEEIRADPSARAAEAAIRSHPITAAAAAGRLHLDSFRTFVLEQHRTARLESVALGGVLGGSIAPQRAQRASRSAPPLGSGWWWGAGAAGRRAAALEQLEALAHALGLEKAQLENYEPMLAAHARAAYISSLATDADAAVAAGALALAARPFGSVCAALASALRRDFGLGAEHTAFLDACADEAALAEFEARLVALVAAGLARGVPRAEIERAARMLQGYEQAFWDAIHRAVAELDEPVLRGAEGRFSLADGASLHYTDAGARDGRVLLLLHGWPDSLHGWRLLGSHLDPRLRVLSVSLRGFGDSWLNPGTAAANNSAERVGTAAANSAALEKLYSAAALAADVRALLARLGVTSVSVVGHSLGALVARALAAAAGAEESELSVEWLFLMACAPVGKKNHVAQKLIPLFRDPLLSIDEQFVQVWQARVVARPAELPEWFRAVVLRESLKVPKAVWRASLEAMAADDHVGTLGRVRARTRILLGAEDRLHPKVDAELLQARLPPGSCELVEIPAVGCLPHWDDPEAVARHIHAALLE